MQCLACNTNNPDTNRFCENCGNQFGAVCAHCGRENGPTAKFCGDCGSKIGPQASVGATPRTFDEPVGQRPPELKIATVLFADIVGSTEKLAYLGPEDAMQRLQPAVQEMCDAVERYGGTVVRTLGDGIMALFGAPRALEGHARLACEAALRMQATFTDASWDLGVRIGLHTGQIASDPTVGVSARSDAVHGLTIHLASRVMASSAPGEIRITQATRAQAGDYYGFHDLGPTPLRGIGEDTPLFALVRDGKDAEMILRRNVRAQFRGRTEEMELLRSAVRQAEANDAPVVGISGEPGSGKSRVCAEFAQWCRTQGVVVHEVRVQLYGHAAPLQPILELFRKCFLNISDADDDATVRKKIEHCLAVRNGVDETPAGNGDQALVADFIGLTHSEELSSTTASAARRARLLEITRHLVQQPRDQVTLILLEDLQWLDEPSLEFLSELVAAVIGTKVLLLLNHRPEFVAAWQAASHYKKVELPDLSDEIVAQIVTDLSGYHRGLTSARDLIVRRSGGNPLFAEELVRSLNDDVISVNQSKLASKIDTLERSLPFSVQSIIGARIDHLDASDKSLLQMCSVIGKDISLTVLERISSEEVPGDINQRLQRLCAGDFIQATSGESGFEYSFRHPLIQEVAYETQLRARRSSVHHAVAVAMEDYYRNRGNEFAALIAHHYAAAGDCLEAAKHEARAANWLASTNASQATKHWRRVRELLKDQSTTKEVASLRSISGARMVYLGWREGLPQEEIQQIVEESLALADQTDVDLLQLLLFAKGRGLQSNGGASDEYMRCVKKALALGAKSTRAGRTALLNIALSQACAWSGLLKEGMAANDAGLAGLADIGDFDREFVGVDVEQWVYGIRVRLMNRLGRFDEAHKLLSDISSRAAASADAVMKQIAHHVYIDLAWCAGSADLVADRSLQVLQIAQSSSSAYAQVFAHNSAGLGAFVAGDYSKANASFQEALKRLKESNAAVEFEPELLASLAECCLKEESYDSAMKHAESGIHAATQQSNRIAECRSLIVLSSVLMRRGELERIPMLLERAKDLIMETGASILQERLERTQREFLGAFDPGLAPSGSAAHQ